MTPRARHFIWIVPLLLLVPVMAPSKTPPNPPPRENKRKATMADETPERSQIPARYRWNTQDLFKSDAAWEKERRALESSFKGIAECKGKLGQGKSMVKSCLDRAFLARKRLARLAGYANRKFDEDTRVATYQGLKEVVDKVATEYGSTSAFIQPELLALPGATLQEMIQDPGFSDYDQFLRDILRLKRHILSPSEEGLLAATSLMRDTGYNVYSSFTGADLKFPAIKDEKGKRVELTQALFTRYRSSASRPVRKAAFDAMFSTFTAYKNTLGSLLSAQVNANIVYAKERKYKSALEAALDQSNIPTSVYRNMIKAINGHLPTLHRYLKLRQKRLRLKDLRYYDMYPSIIGQVDLKYPYEEAAKVLTQAMAPLGQAYVGVLAQGLDPKNGWVDPFPNKGKRSGAYMDGGAYDVHPYVLGNYLGDYESLSMVAHEMGHALHSYSTNKRQPFAKADYSIFVAEVASTLNEALLMRHMLRTVTDPKKKLFLLGQQLESFRQTLFRQAMFAEFELALYERAERKEALTADEISKIYLKIVRRYYGHDQKVVLIDDLYGMEWAYVPHFYYDFYVFQYVTGITAATALAEAITKDGDKASQRYVKHLLEAGSSDYPIQLLKRAGVDLTTTKPYDMAMAVFERTLAEAEELVEKQK
jgi:oligoendopeptidase F